MGTGCALICTSIIAQKGLLAAFGDMAQSPLLAPMAAARGEINHGSMPYLRALGTSLRVEDFAADTEAQAVSVELQAVAPYCPCPSCQLPAERIHSHYRRTVAQRRTSCAASRRDAGPGRSCPREARRGG